MNDELHNQFEAHVAAVVRPIAAGPRRKRVMREELLGHLLAIYDEEAGRRGEGPAARQAAVRRFGDAGELGRQLQSSVPWLERALWGWSYGEEMLMSRQWWIGCGVAATVMVTLSLVFPRFAPFILFSGTATIIGASLVRWRPALGWLVGFAALLFGMSIVLPGLAKIKHAGVVPEAVWGVTLGGLVVLSGLVLLAYRTGVKFLRTA